MTAVFARTRAVVVGLVLFAGGPAWGDDGLRCGAYLVTVGMRSYEITAKCGPPSRADRYNYRHRWACGVIDIWTYDRGPREFIRVLTLENGVLTNVEVGGYGSRRATETSTP